MKKKILFILRNLGSLAIGAIILWWIFRSKDLASMKEDFANAHYLWVLFPKVFSMLAHFTRAARWRLLIKPLGYNPSVWNSFYAVMIGYLTNHIAPRMGEVSRCLTLKRTDNVPVPQLLGTVVMERVVDMVILLLLIPLVMVVKFDVLKQFFMTWLYDPLMGKLDALGSKSVVIVVVLAVLLALGIAAYLLIRKFSHISIVQKVIGIFKNIYSGLISVRQMKQRGLFIFYSVWIWFMYLVSFFFTLRAIDETANLGLTDALFGYTLGGMAMVAPIQGGIGAYHWMVTEGLYLLGISREGGLAFATLVHGSSMLLLISVGLISLMIVMAKYGTAPVVVSADEVTKEVDPEVN